MTDAQKNSIVEYRKKGYGYKKISQIIDISENTVKSFCKRNGLSGQAVSVQAAKGRAICKCCGAVIIRIPGRKTKQFCSDHCRNTWWNSHLDLVKRKANYESVCQLCGKVFSTYGNAHRKYCSHACYIEYRFGGKHCDERRRTQGDCLSDDDEGGENINGRTVYNKRTVQTI